MPNDVIRAVPAKNSLHYVLQQLRQNTTLEGFWKNLFELCKEHFDWSGICFVIMEGENWQVESVIERGKFLDGVLDHKFFNDNPLLYDSVKQTRTVEFVHHELNIMPHDAFFNCWLPKQNFENLYVFPYIVLKNNLLEKREICIFIATEGVSGVNELESGSISLFSLYVSQLYEKILMMESLDIVESRLLNNDKFSTLGHLTAGIAHEMNSPLGAITAASCNIRDSSKKILTGFSELLEYLTEQNKTAFLNLLTLAMSPKEFLTSREERAKRRTLTATLAGKGIEHVEEIVDILIDVGVYEDSEPLIESLGDKVLDILSFINQFASIERNNRNVQNAVERAAKMISAIKSYSKREDEMHMNNVQDTITNVLMLYQHDLKQEINLVTNIQSVPRVFCNQDELNQVWTNLIYNALQAMNFAGTLQVDVYQDNAHVVVSISDTGSGIAENIQHRIFEPYFTTKPRGVGSGLGLDIVKQIVSKHGGTIDFKSQPGNTIFFVRLPIKEEEESERVT